jgi:hypothetical protein
VEYLLPIYRVSLALEHYLLNRMLYNMTVMCKPGRPNYTQAKAHQPICLLKTIAKALLILMTEYILYLAECYNLLPATHFRFCYKLWPRVPLLCTFSLLHDVDGLLGLCTCFRLGDVAGHSHSLVIRLGTAATS